MIQPTSTRTPSPRASTLKRVESEAAHAVLPRVHDVLVRSPGLNQALGVLTEPLIKQKFNAPSKPGADHGPAPLSAATIEQARSIMAANFHPEQGKVLVGISGGGKETVHAFVVTGVKPDGRVQITQAIAQTGNTPESYRGIGGHVSEALDKLLGNPTTKMQGVVTDDWSSYAQRSGRNSIAILELDADPARVAQALDELKSQVGKPYDGTMLAAPTPTAATQQGMYCTELSSWFVNRIRPGTIQPSDVMGYPLYQVSDHMRATTLHGGPMKVLYNGENRLDIAGANPFPR